MTESELHQILELVRTTPSEQCESDTVEFKNYRDEHSLNNDKDLADEVVALANHRGGVVIFGVENNDKNEASLIRKQLQGFVVRDPHEVCERIKGRLRPKIEIQLKTTVFLGATYPYLIVPKVNWILVTTTSGKVYIRDGKSSRPMEPQEIEAAVKRLQSYDWSSESLETPVVGALDQESIVSAKNDFCRRRNIQAPLGDSDFLESIGATKNGQLTKTGLVFLGKPTLIRQLLGDFEYRFSYKTTSGALKANEVWSSNIWVAISKYKSYFAACNDSTEVEYEKKKYKLFNLDEIAFHEALLNAFVHRDYAVNGMISVVFSGTEIAISNPGGFYGGVTEENITSHEPRHRNKDLAKCLMAFHLVDRAGMGVLRMGIGSLKYGRRLPEFRETNESIVVKMQTEYFIPTIFVLTQENPDAFGLLDLIVLNRAVEKGYVLCDDLITTFAKLSASPWSDLVKTVETGVCRHYVELVGNSIGVFVRVNGTYSRYFKLSRTFPSVPNSARYIKLYKMLKEHSNVTNDEIAGHLELQTGAYLSKFLNNTGFIKKEGKTRSTRWMLR